MTYTEVHINPDYPKEFKVRLPTKRAYGLVNPHHWLTYTIKPYDVNSKYTQCLEPTEHAPGLSIRCGMCGKEMTSLLNVDNGLLCFMCTHVTASRFCLEALARAAYEAWGLEYDYGRYVREKEALERSYARAAEFMESWIEALENAPKPKPIKTKMVMAGKRIVYLVGRE